MHQEFHDIDSNHTMLPEPTIIEAQMAEEPTVTRAQIAGQPAATELI